MKKSTEITFGYSREIGSNFPSKGDTVTVTEICNCKKEKINCPKCRKYIGDYKVTKSELIENVYKLNLKRIKTVKKSTEGNK